MAHLFNTSRIGPIETRNRFVHSATYECLAETDGSVTPALIQRYGTLARGEVGLIIPGFMYVHPRGRGYRRQTGIHCDEMIAGLEQLVQAVHQKGGRIVFQLAHGGRQCPRKVTRQAPLAPSGFGRDPVSLNKASAARDADIAAIIDQFSAAARRAREAGADGVQLHAAHGYLLNEFLSPFFNRRGDQWGDSPEGRFRIIREIIGSIRRACGAHYPILIKLNTDDFTPQQGITPDLAATYTGWLRELDIAAVEISGGTYYTFHMSRGEVPIDDMARALPFWMRPLAKMIFRKQIEPCRFKALYHEPAARIIKPVLGDVPLILVGGVRKLEEMKNIIDQGIADFISMSRPFIREPFLVKRLREDKCAETSCISCNNCLAAVFNDLPLRCYVDGLPG